MGKDDEEREQIQDATARIDEYVAEQGEEQPDHKQEGESDLVDATMVIENQTVLEDQYVQNSEVLSGKPSEERRESAATSSNMALAEVVFENRTRLSPMMIERRWNLKMLVLESQMPDS